MAKHFPTENGGNVTVGCGPIVDGRRMYFVELEYQGDALRLNLTNAECRKLIRLLSRRVPTKH